MVTAGGRGKKTKQKTQNPTVTTNHKLTRKPTNKEMATQTALDLKKKKKKRHFIEATQCG